MSPKSPDNMCDELLDTVKPMACGTGTGAYDHGFVLRSQVIVSPPDLPLQDLPPGALARMGVFLERCVTASGGAAIKPVVTVDREGT